MRVTTKRSHSAGEVAGDAHAVRGFTAAMKYGQNGPGDPAPALQLLHDGEDVHLRHVGRQRAQVDHRRSLQLRLQARWTAAVIRGSSSAPHDARSEPKRKAARSYCKSSQVASQSSRARLSTPALQHNTPISDNRSRSRMSDGTAGNCAHLRHGAQGHGLLQHRHGARVVAQVWRIVPDTAEAGATTVAAAAKGAGSQRRDGRLVGGGSHLSSGMATLRRSQRLTTE